MKKLLLIILSAVVVSSAFAGNFDGKGVIPGWKFAPVQVGVGIFESANLFDADSVALLSIGLLGIQQYSSIISVGGITELENNYGIQVSAASLTDRNYGLMIGLLENYTDVNENYGIKIGITNSSGKFAKFQLLGIDFFDYLQVGFLNGHTYIDNVLQIGIFNTTSNGGVQLGLLNYNENALIKWMPFFNFGFEKEEK
ncbi:MAG: hypothetical protein IKB25_01680 [Lentisphaeria bacterium]|nr:hypothetical protein [Lentisphaeria bacterium]